MNIVYKCFEVNKKYYVYDREKNVIFEVNKDDYDLLSIIKSDKVFEQNIDKLEKYIKRGFFKKTKLCEIEHPLTDSIEELIDNRAEQLILQVTQNCNLRCSYCFYGQGNYDNRTHSGKRMTFETAKKGIDYILNHSSNLESIYISFYGGEPLLEIDLIRKCVDYVEKKVEGKKIIYSMTTNGTLFTEEIINFLDKYDFQVVISLDGTKEMHDLNRKFVNGKGSFDIIMDNLKNIKKSHYDFAKRIMFNTVIAPKSDFSCIKNFVEHDEIIGDNFVSANIVNDLYTSNNYNDYDEKFYIVDRYGEFKLLLAVLGKLDKKFASKIFQERMMHTIRTYRGLTEKGEMFKRAHPGGPCIPGVHRIFINVDEEIYPCERVSESSSPMNIGNLNKGIDIKKATDLINIGQLTEDECKQCWAFHYCDMCAAFADDTETISRSKRLSKCKESRRSILEDFKDICMLKDFKFDFEGEIFDEKVNNISF
ncbi:Cys-rich peptide radical SAM maturase CcpM [Clostridium botulinum]|uniref:Cys-rich peptide radical SAM maturase CcpM n=1 Tax=Clostridium botulinum TaxID=1491 RepID=UPI000D12A1A8|nr:Cys-rich peptide radical SAM maturase CcpM [Clostridium botulinum]AVQ45786.1 Cys-rich peptide radical SAM maturase CcpM [Clostridium botulinum]AVQ48424.1 Cys-rich peptide radical SAM maturase CcpM [Clostridium botulinum]